MFLEIVNIDDEFVRKYYEGYNGIDYSSFYSVISDKNNVTLTDGKYVATIYFNGDVLFVIHDKRLSDKPNVMEYVRFSCEDNS